MMRPFTRLRWQLILSHLAAIAFTLISMVAAVALMVSGWIASQEGSPAGPAQDARSVAVAVGGLVIRGASSTELNVVLRALAGGDLRVLSGPHSWVAGHDQLYGPLEPSLRDAAYLVIVGPDGQPLASSDPAGAAFAPQERSEWEALASLALAGVRDPSRLVVVRSGTGPAALGAYPVLNSQGRPVAAVLVASPVLPQESRVSRFWRGLAIFGAGTAAVLAAASVFALVSAGSVGYLLSRRLVARLERLGAAAEALAHGDLSRRVEEGPPDEVGLLARRFNSMADRLETTVAELAAAKGHVEATLRTKRELVANVSHELRTPLALIRSHVESLLMRKGNGATRGCLQSPLAQVSTEPALLERRRRLKTGPRANGAKGMRGVLEEEPDEQSEYLAIIARETEHLSRLIDDLFTLSTAETGALPLRLEPVSLGEVVEQVASSMRPIAQRERRISVVTTVAPDLAPALADRQRIVQVLGNLVRNALRHTPEGGLIALRAERQDNHAVVSVEDTGEGIPPDQLPHVFERFYRGDGARDRASGGAGLGLAIVRELVEAMGGDVSAESIIGEGSRFSFRLPLH